MVIRWGRHFRVARVASGIILMITLGIFLSIRGGVYLKQWALSVQRILWPLEIRYFFNTATTPVARAEIESFLAARYASGGMRALATVRHPLMQRSTCMRQHDGCVIISIWCSEPWYAVSDDSILTRQGELVLRTWFDAGTCENLPRIAYDDQASLPCILSLLEALPVWVQNSYRDISFRNGVLRLQAAKKTRGKVTELLIDEHVIARPAQWELCKLAINDLQQRADVARHAWCADIRFPGQVILRACEGG